MRIISCALLQRYMVKRLPAGGLLLIKYAALHLFYQALHQSLFELPRKISNSLMQGSPGFDLLTQARRAHFLLDGAVSPL